jgi:L,D-peptidoglycan transpeptidase YkuD (ErfK/YbiS/YcfS/YnhG family)
MKRTLAITNGGVWGAHAPRVHVSALPPKPSPATAGIERNELALPSIAFSPVRLNITNVIRKITLPSVVICALALAVYFYAHHNWHPLPSGMTIDRIVVEKAARKLSIFRDGRQLKTYRVALGRSPVGPKEKEGDMKTPEGIYKIDGRNAQSSFHLALHISYPSNDDNARAAERGVSAGFDIMIHGIQNGRGWIGAFHRWKDWTAGCIALGDEEIEELWRVTPDGTIIEIRP